MTRFRRLLVATLIVIVGTGIAGIVPYARAQMTGGTPTVQFSAADYLVTETAGTATITVTLSMPSTEEVKVNYATTDDSAVAPDDYVAASGTLTFAAGETSKTFTVTVKDDGNMEPTEKVKLTLSNPVNANLGWPSEAALWISDTTNPILVFFSQPEFECWEFDGSTTLTVNLSAASDGAVTVNYQPQDDTAVKPADYDLTANTLIFAPSETSKDITVSINYEEAKEPTEYFKVTLNNPIGALLGTVSEAKVKIKEPEVTLTSDGNVMMLLDKNTFTVTATPPAPDSSEIQIRRASKPAPWYKLGDGPTKTDWQAKIAGLMKLRAKAVFKGKNYYSDESGLEIEFPAYGDIEGNADVQKASDDAWTATKKDATDSYNDNGKDPAKAKRRERGFWVFLNTGTGKYEFGATLLGPWVGDKEDGSLDMGAKPADDPNPAPDDPTSTCKYLVTSLHTHTPTAYRTGGDGFTRGVGPSDADQNGDTALDLPGIVYDYLESPAGSGSIPMGHPIDSGAQRYHSMGKNRRSTPP